MRNILVILALFVCTSICLGGEKVDILENTNLRCDDVSGMIAYFKISGNSGGRENGVFKYGQLKDPNGSTVTVNSPSQVGSVYGAYMDDASVIASNNKALLKSMTNNKVIVQRGRRFYPGSSDFNKGDIAGAWADDTIGYDMYVSSNSVIIRGGSSEINNVYGGRTIKGIVSSNTVTIGIVEGVTIDESVYGAMIGRDGLASSNTVTITSGAVKNVYGGYIAEKGTATLNKVHLTSVTVGKDVYGGKIGKDEFGEERIGSGLASSNTVTITSGAVKNVYGGYIKKKGTATLNKVHLTSVTVMLEVYGARIEEDGLASSNTVTINGGIIGVGRIGFGLGVFGARISNITTATATGNEVHLTSVTVMNNVFGAWIARNGLVSSNTVTIKGGKIERNYSGIVGGNIFGGHIANGTATINTVHLTSVTVTNDVFGAWIGEDGLARDNRVTITSGAVGNVYGGHIGEKGTATWNKVNLTSVTVTKDVYGARIGKTKAERAEDFEGAEAERDITYVLASSNTVTITGGRVGKDVCGGYIYQKGTATLNTVNLTSVTVSGDIYGAWIGEDGLASSNTVIITSGTVGRDVYGGFIDQNGTATLNTVTINGGKIGGNVFGGYVKGNGKAIYNTITITGTEQSSPEFSTTTILCGGAATNDAFTGNTLNIVETKGVVVNGISNFEKYNFHLKDIKSGETILTATSGGRSWDVGMSQYTTACKVDLSRSNIHLRTQIVLNKGEYCTLIKSPQGFEDNGAHKQFSFDNGGLVEYSWEIRVADNEQDLIATLNRKELREGKAKPLLEGNVTGMVCINNGMDCIISKMEETESLLGEGAKLQRKGEIGAFYGLLANKSSYDDTGSHIDMTGMSMMGGIGIGWKGLVTGAFGEYGTGNSDIDSGSCSCEKKSEGKSNYVGGGLLGRYNVCEDEFRGTKLYLEAILRAGEVSNTFNIKEAKDGAEKECKYNDETTMYGGCALGGGYKHKVGEKMDVDWSLRYMFGYQDGKDVEKPVDVYGNRVKLESVTSSRIRVGVRGKYVELEKVKPYIGIWYEHELSGKVKGAIQNGVDNVGDIPATSFEGGTGIGELGVSGKVGKLGVGISGQGYLGVRKGFGGMLKLKYAFGKDVHAKPPKPQPKD